MIDTSGIDLPSLISSYGIETRKSGNSYFAVCPFHSDSDPSMCISLKGKWRFKCFGCGEGGDAIDFVKRMDGCDTKEALRRLGIKSIPESREHMRRKQRALENFDYWCRKVGTELQYVICYVSDLVQEDFEKHGYLYHHTPKWQWWADILNFGSKQEKYELYRELRNRIRL